MNIEVIINGSIINRVPVKADLPVTGFSKKEFEDRKRLIDSYLHELRKLYPKADFQLAYESRIHLVQV